MSDNVVKFRPIKKKPENKAAKPAFNVKAVPSWLAWVGLIVVAIGLSVAQFFGIGGA